MFMITPLVTQVRAEERALERIERDLLRTPFENLKALRALQLVRSGLLAPETMYDLFITFCHRHSL